MGFLRDGKSMIMVTAKIRAKPSKRDNIISKSKDLIDRSRLDEGNISYNLYAATEDDDILLILEQWENPEVLKAHMQTEHFKAFNRAIEDDVAGEMDVSIYSAEKI